MVALFISTYWNMALIVLMQINYAVLMSLAVNGCHSLSPVGKERMREYPINPEVDSEPRALPCVFFRFLLLTGCFC